MQIFDPYLGEKTARFLAQESPLLLPSDKPVTRSIDLVHLNAEMAFEHFQNYLSNGGAPKGLIAVNNMTKAKKCQDMRSAMLKCVKMTAAAQINKS